MLPLIGQSRKRGVTKVFKIFLEMVRSGKAPDYANLFMADTVLAHQMNAQEQFAVKRTLKNYSKHVRVSNNVWQF